MISWYKLLWPALSKRPWAIICKALHSSLITANKLDLLRRSKPYINEPQYATLIHNVLNVRQKGVHTNGWLRINSMCPSRQDKYKMERKGEDNNKRSSKYSKELTKSTVPEAETGPEESGYFLDQFEVHCDSIWWPLDSPGQTGTRVHRRANIHGSSGHSA